MDSEKNQFAGIDIGKIGALHDSGWSNADIAADMEIEVETVEEALAYRKVHPEDLQESETEKPRLVVLSEEEINSMFDRAASIGAKEAMKRYEQERKRETTRRKDRRLHNTRLLLRNYRALKEHAESAVFSRSRMEGSALEILESFMQGEDSEVKIDSIKRSAERTAIMITHIDAMIGLYEAFCEKAKDGSLERRRYDVMWDMYIADVELTPDEIAEKQNISKNSVYADLRIATERLTALIFGVDGMTIH